jgi:autotransporter-associated beta strand protein
VTGGGGDGGGGSAYGTGIFLQGNQTQTLAPGSGQTLTISDAIADQSGNGGTGHGSLVIDGAGTVDLTAANTFTGGVTIDSGRLVLGGTAAAGGGTITFGGGDPPILAFTIANAPTNTIDGFPGGGTIDITNLTFNAGTSAASIVGGHTLSITNGTTTVTLTLASGDYSADLPFAVTDHAGGTDAGLALMTVDSFDQLQEAIEAVDVQTSGSYTITLSGSIAETADLLALNLHSGVSVTIDGDGGTLDGGGGHRGLFVYAGTVTVENLTIADAHAVGGRGRRRRRGRRGAGRRAVRGRDERGPGQRRHRDAERRDVHRRRRHWRQW